MSTPTRCLVIPDLHIPFHHPNAFSFIKRVKKDTRAQKVIQLGDLLDMYSNSRWERSPDMPSARQEIAESKEAIKELAEIVPIMHICIGNHEQRLLKLVTRSGLSRVFVRELSRVYEFPCTWWVGDTWNHQGVLYQHGMGYSGKYAHMQAAMDAMQPTCLGHLHAYAGVQYIKTEMGQVWGMNCGCLVDDQSEAFSYGRDMRHKPVLAVGMIEKGVPRIIPMP